MNAVIDHFPGPGFDALPDRKQTTRIAAGIAISLAVHALLLSIYRQPRPAALPATVTETLTVRLQAAPEHPPVAEPALPAAQPAPRSKPPAHTRPARRIIAVPPPAAPSEEGFKVDTQPAAPPADAAPEATPRFNLDAARKLARQVADEPDPAKVGTALERLPPPPLQTENKFERAIKGAKRADCKDGVPGGLLAPIFLAMDKKDSGCKW
ncbi:hypothetical protein ACI48D_06005 [Massilia sp. LXY-6]|uniref:hypothetical protein n=1 Tax=Massilia sp. LXY-6 TaxID=3379823 RepID=UPI003EDEF30D